MKAIIDGDPLVYIVGFGNDEMPLWYQCEQMDDFIRNLLKDVGADNFSLYLTGKGNFRFETATILPYKGQRDKSHRPKQYAALREYLLSVWDAKLVQGMEADDACGIDAYRQKDLGNEYVVCSIDKDLLMLEGKHFNYKRKEFYEVDETQAWQTFYLQTLTGDSSDNIPGLYKVAGVKASKKIKEPLLSIQIPEAMDEYCSSVYLEKGATIQQYREIQELLWIRRKPLKDTDHLTMLLESLSETPECGSESSTQQ